MKRKPYEPPRLLQLQIADVPKKALHPKHARQPQRARHSSPRRRDPDAPSQREGKPRRGRSSASANVAARVPEPSGCTQSSQERKPPTP